LKKVNIYEAKTRLSQFVDEAASGRDVIIASDGRPIVRLTRLGGKEPEAPAEFSGRQDRPQKVGIPAIFGRCH
jgi:antitoxin (DNA-binding transcriptional repressor) of toxin-antitoxin stability system